jgi:hypothetical protein
MDRQSRLDELLSVISKTEDMRARSQLMKIYWNCKKIHDDISRESVECRRLQKVTPKYTELEQKFDESVNQLEQWATFAKLLY